MTIEGINPTNVSKRLQNISPKRQNNPGVLREILFIVPVAKLQMSLATFAELASISFKWIKDLRNRFLMEGVRTRVHKYTLLEMSNLQSCHIDHTNFIDDD